MASFDHDKDEDKVCVEMQKCVNELHFNFARPYMRFNQTPGRFEFDAAPQAIHFDIEGSVNEGGGDCNSCFPDGGQKDDVLVKQSNANGDALWTNVLDAGGF